MAGLMVIRPDEDGAWTWMPAAGGADAVIRGSATEAARAAAGQRAVVLVPGTEVSLELAQVPVRSRRNAVATLPWALEDHLVDDVEALHFAVGTRTADDRWPVAIVARAYIDRLLDACTQAGLEPQVLVPEPLALPAPPEGTWVALEEPGRITVRSGDDSGFACEPGMLATVLGGTEPPDELVRYCTPRAPDDPWPEAFAAPVRAAERVACAEPLAAFAEATSPRINLLQGAYARSSRHMRQLRRWLLPAALAAGVAVLALAHATVAHLALVERERELRGQMERIYRQLFPEAERVVDPRAQLEGQLNELRERDGDGGGFMDALGRLTAPLSDDEGVRVSALEWRNGTIDLAVRTSELERIDRVQQELQGAGFATELRDVERNDDQVIGRMRLREADR